MVTWISRAIFQLVDRSIFVSYFFFSRFLIAEDLDDPLLKLQWLKILLHSSWSCAVWRSKDTLILVPVQSIDDLSLLLLPNARTGIKSITASMLKRNLLLGPGHNRSFLLLPRDGGSSAIGKWVMVVLWQPQSRGRLDLSQVVAGGTPRKIRESNRCW